MFTGIIEEVGMVGELRRRDAGASIVVGSRHIWRELSIGESVAVNGVCLTVVEKGEGAFTADISEESLGRSTLGKLRRGTSLNLERALSLNSRLGGHIVLGHVDGMGEVRAIHGSGEGLTFTFSYPGEAEGYLVEKGSIAVDGVSLTISAMGEGEFSVAIIPHTMRESNLESLKVGGQVNLETDILAKYVRSLLADGLPSRGDNRRRDEDLYRKLLEGGFA